MNNDQVSDQKPIEVSSNKRREFLSLLGVAGAGGAASMLSEKWTKPLLNSVILPAHAQMSPAVEPPIVVDPPACTPLMISGITELCPAAIPPVADDNEIIEAYVDDSGDCPELILGSFAGPIPTPALTVLRVSIRPASAIFGNNTRLSVQIAGAQTFAFYNCVTMAATDNANFGAFTRPFTASSGATWDASYTISATGTGITLSDILLVPR